MPSAPEPGRSGRPHPPRSSSLRSDAAGKLYARNMPDQADEPRLRAVVQETLRAPGGLTRLRLALLAGSVLGLRAGTTQALATGVEYFHTASLLLDDLPAMDDSRQRRGRPCAHRRHGEAAAILGALAFINRAYALFWKSITRAASPRRSAAAAHAERWLGALGVLGGQSLDVHFPDTDGSARTVARAALGKTVSLLRLTLVTPAILAGVDVRERLLLDRLAVYWGLAYQLADDFADLQPGMPLGKSAGRDAARGRPNHVKAVGKAAAAQRLARLLALVQRTVAGLVQIRAGWVGLEALVRRLQAVAPKPEAASPTGRQLRCA